MNIDHNNALTIKSVKTLNDDAISAWKNDAQVRLKKRSDDAENKEEKTAAPNESVKTNDMVRLVFVRYYIRNIFTCGLIVISPVTTHLRMYRQTSDLVGSFALL
jgi:hypothetical protein